MRLPWRVLLGKRCFAFADGARRNGERNSRIQGAQDPACHPSSTRKRARRGAAGFSFACQSRFKALTRQNSSDSAMLRKREWGRGRGAFFR
jgi:hypothetical protein